MGAILCGLVVWDTTLSPLLLAVPDFRVLCTTPLGLHRLRADELIRSFDKALKTVT